MSSMGFSMLNPNVYLRSTLQSIPDESPSPFDRIVHDQGLSTSAASGGLKPPPIRRLRWAYHHLLYSIATRAFLTHLGLPHRLHAVFNLVDPETKTARSTWREGQKCREASR